MGEGAEAASGGVRVRAGLASRDGFRVSDAGAGAADGEFIETADWVQFGGGAGTGGNLGWGFPFDLLGG